MTWITNWPPGYIPPPGWNMNWQPPSICYPTQGWQCPCCKKVYSPTTTMCFTCGQQGTTTTATGMKEKTK